MGRAERTTREGAPTQQSREPQSPESQGPVFAPGAPTPARVVVAEVQPTVDAGRYPVKRVIGERVEVEATLFAEGHDRLGGVLRFRPATAADWRERPLEPRGHDAWGSCFEVDSLGRWEYAIEA
jgi:starch synthase (maltosyl-transferring)